MATPRWRQGEAFLPSWTLLPSRSGGAGGAAGPAPYAGGPAVEIVTPARSPNVHTAQAPMEPCLPTAGARSSAVASRVVSASRRTRRAASLRAPSIRRSRASAP
eukprot:6286596-Lingulodinium_polyedra.AAC.1